MTGIKAQLATLLSKEMDRKDFLKHVAAAGFMIAGGSVLVQSIGGINKLTQGDQGGSSKVSSGYGMSAYGGRSNA